MTPRGFNHLHVHTEYSLLDGAGRIGDLVAGAADMGMEALAVTDHGVMYGAYTFYKACRERGVKPIVGCEVYVARRTRHDRVSGQDDDPFHLVLLARNRQGYNNLLRLVSRAYTEGLYYKPRVDTELLVQYSDGLIALSACLGGEIPHRLSRGDFERAAERAAEYRDIFGRENFFLELQDHGIPEQKTVNGLLVDLARRLELPLVATNDVHYVRREDAEAHDILLCIQTGKSVTDQNRMRFPGSEFYLKSRGEMERLFTEVPEALDNTVAIAERCQLELEFGEIHVPHYDVPGGSSHSEYLAGLCRRRLERRYPVPGPEVEQRLEYELAMIDRMGYPGYFLIVWDFIEFARSRGIPVGPGRGSAAGSLVAYVLGITDIDPLEHGLLFERFLNPERVTMPDMDIDFCYERRDEVIEYVVGKYGKDCVAQIITFGTMAARAVIRDVGRALDMPYAEVDRIAKMIPWQLGMTLDRALETAPEFLAMYREQPGIRRLVDLGRALEGLPRHASVHAAGVVISEHPLTEYVPLQKTGDGSIITQFTMEILEEMGLLKMDFLGLRTLTVMHDAVRLAAASGHQLQPPDIPLDDEATYRQISEGHTMGVFQLESGGMRDMIRELKPSCFEDVIAAVALFRPGPMENIPEFIRNKHHGGVKYLHPDLEPILKDTYGIMVYQEQIMRVASVMAGFSLGQADILRRAMGKKKKEIIDQMKSEFVKGCLARGHDRRLAGEIYNLIEKFANYGFNKCHSAPYGLLAYQTAYLKTHFPREYMAALLTSIMSNSDKVAEYINECRRMGIQVLPPDVNRSGLNFSVEGDDIRFGLAAVKNVGRGVIEELVAERDRRGLFTSLRDFCERVDGHLLNRRALESLIKAGAFDSLGARRSQLLHVLEKTLQGAQEIQKIRRNGQVTFFDVGLGAAPGRPVLATSDELPDLPELARRRLLTLEKEVLGVYVSGHPLAGYARELAELASTDVPGLAATRDGETVTVGGLVMSVKPILTRNGESMAFVGLEDMTSQVEVVVFPGVMAVARDLIKEDAPLLVKGRVSIQEEEVKILAEEILPLGRGGRLYLDLEPLAGDDASSQALQELQGLLRAYHGNTPVYLSFDDARRAVLVHPRYWVTRSPGLDEELDHLCGPGNWWADDGESPEGEELSSASHPAVGKGFWEGNQN